MKKIWALLFGITLFAAAIPLNATSSISWRTDFDQVVEESKQSGKPIFLLFTMPDSRCPACLKLKQNLLENNDFLNDFGDKFHFVKVLYSKDLSEAETAKNEKIEDQFMEGSGYPDVQIVGPVGSTVKKLSASPIGNSYSQNDYQKLSARLRFAIDKQKKQIVLQE